MPRVVMGQFVKREELVVASRFWRPFKQISSQNGAPLQSCHPAFYLSIGTKSICGTGLPCPKTVDLAFGF